MLWYPCVAHMGSESTNPAHIMSLHHLPCITLCPLSTGTMSKIGVPVQNKYERRIAYQKSELTIVFVEGLCQMLSTYRWCAVFNRDFVSCSHLQSLTMAKHNSSIGSKPAVRTSQIEPLWLSEDWKLSRSPSESIRESTHWLHIPSALTLSSFLSLSPFKQLLMSHYPLQTSLSPSSAV